MAIVRVATDLEPRIVYQFKSIYYGLSTASQVFTRVSTLVSTWAQPNRDSPSQIVDSLDPAKSATN